MSPMTPNPSIEGAASGVLRTPPAAAPCRTFGVMNNLVRMCLPRMFLLLLLTVVTGLGAQSVPRDEAAFTAYVAERLTRELTGFAIQSVGRLTLEGKGSDGESTGQLSLDRIYGFCNRDAGRCPEAIEHYVKGMAEFVRERSRPVEKSMVRLVIRQQSYVDQAKHQMGSGPPALYFRPLAANLVVVPVLDFTRSIRFVGEKDLQRLGVDVDGLFQLGERNLRASLRPLREVAPTPVTHSFGRITGEEYASSRIIFHSDWSELAAKLNQQLVVMLPAPDVLLYGDGSTQVRIDALRTFGTEAARGSQRPLSPVLLRWTISGWEQVR
jgi:uncharacterized protein YtpQ (UPF0354 family)